MEGETISGAVREVSEEGGSGTDHLRKFLSRVGLGGATLWVENLGVDGSDDAKTRGGTHGFPVTGDGNEGSKAGGQDLAKGGGRYGAPSSREKISSGIHQQ